MAVLIVAAITLVPLLALATSPRTLYLSGSTTPVASLSTNTPPGGALPDYDGSGDPGRLLDKTSNGWLETDHDKYQLFKAPAGGLAISGQASLTVWVQMKDDEDEKTGVVNAYLLDCAGTCSLLASASKTLTPGGPFVQTTLTFSDVSHTFAPGHDVGLKVVVGAQSDDDMNIAYYRSSYPSRLVLPEIVATTTTTTTSSTTTTVAGTTTTGAPTTTLAGITTTSSGAAGPGPSTSTTVGSAGTTEPGAGAPVTTIAGETTTTGSDPGDEGGALSGQGTTTSPTLIAQPVSLDTEKSNLVVRTTPSQRGVTIEAASGDLSPVEGLMVSFLTAVESIRSQFATSAALGALMTILLIVGLSRRRHDE